MSTMIGDVLMDGKPYLLDSYDIMESVRTRPAPPSQPRSLSGFEHQNQFTYFGQSSFLGEGYPIWEGDGPYRDGYGLNPDPAGVLEVARQMAQDHADAVNVDGWIAFRIGYPHPPTTPNDIVVFIGKTDGVSHVKNTVSGTWTCTAAGHAWGLAGTEVAVSHEFFSRVTLIGTSEGKVVRTDDGQTFTNTLGGDGSGRPDASVAGMDAWILGSLKGMLYVGYENGSIWRMAADLTWDPDPFLEDGTLDMTPMFGAAGTNVLYMITQGPSPRILYTDGENLYQANIISTDFAPRAAIFLGKLFMFGDQGFDVATKGACWVLSADGLAEDLSFGDGQVAQGITTAQVEGEQILWTATGNSTLGRSGIGVWDPRLDQSVDRPLGFYISNTLPYSAGKKADGIAVASGQRYVGITGDGIYKTTTPGPFKVRMSAFGGESRNIQKRWLQAEVNHTPLLASQIVTVATSKDPDGTVDAWGSSSVDGERSKVIEGPAQYRNPFISLIVSGDAAGSAMKLYDVALAYIPVPDHANTKREWIINVAVEGHDEIVTAGDSRPRERQRMRDGSENTRTSIQIKADLDLLWNTEICFQDIDGAEYNVLVKAPSDRPKAGDRGGEIDRFVDDTALIVNLSLQYTLHLIETTDR